MAATTREAVLAAIQARLPDNLSRKIRAVDVRDVLSAVAESTVFQSDPVDYASQAQAVAGTDTAKPMNPLRTKQAIDAQTPPIVGSGIDARLATELEAEAGTNAVKLLTPQRGMDLITARGKEAAFTPSGTGAVTTTVDAALKSAFAETRDHPMNGQFVMMERSSILSTWPSGIIWRDEQDELFMVDIVGTGHTMDEGAHVVVRRSQDGGDTWAETKTIFSRADDNYIRAAAFGRMASGRIGGVVTTGGTTRKQWFVYTDDQFATVTVTEITASVPITNHFVYGMLLPWPTAAGGDDTNGFQVITYGGTASIKSIRTSDNGATWSDVTLKDGTGLPGGAQPQEPSMVQLADGRHIIFVRISTNGNCYATTAPADMSSWSDWVDTGIPLGGNPVHALIDDDELHVYVQYREVSPGSVDDNTLVLYSARAAAVYANPALIGTATPIYVATLPTRAIGYIQSVKSERGDWYHVMKAGEGPSTTGGSGASTILCRQRPGAVRGVSLVDNPRQVISNPIFRTWPRGTAWTGITVDEGGPGRWRINCSGATVSAQQITIPADIRGAFPFKTEHGFQISNAGSPEDFVGIQQRWIGDDAVDMAMHLENRKRVTVRLYGWGAFPPKWQATFVVNGGTSAGIATFPRPQGIDGDGPWVTEVEMTISSLATLGIAPSAVTSFQINFYNGSGNSEFTLNLAGVFVFTGPPALEPPIPTLPADEYDTRRYCERIATIASETITTGVARTSTIVWADLQYSEKVGNPTITVSAATDIHVRNTGDVVASSISFAGAREKSARMAITTAGVTSGAGYLVEVVASPSASPFIQVDLGY
jgi:hypothetical protein